MECALLSRIPTWPPWGRGWARRVPIHGDEVPFLAHSRLGPPGLLIWCGLWESQLLLMWQIWFALGLLPCPL